MRQTIDQATVAGNVRMLKGFRRVSDEFLAEATGLSRTAVNDRLNGRARFQIEELPAFAAAFDVTVDRLFAPLDAEVSA